MTATADKFLVLTDGFGGYHLIPMQVVEDHRVTAEQQAQVQALADDADVRGQVLLHNLSGNIIIAPGGFRIPPKTGAGDLQSVDRPGVIKA
jgi:hypothetical protein